VINLSRYGHRCYRFEKRGLPCPFSAIESDDSRFEIEPDFDEKDTPKRLPYKERASVKDPTVVKAIIKVMAESEVPKQIKEAKAPRGGGLFDPGNVIPRAVPPVPTFPKPPPPVLVPDPVRVPVEALRGAMRGFLRAVSSDGRVVPSPVTSPSRQFAEGRSSVPAPRSVGAPHLVPAVENLFGQDLKQAVNTSRKPGVALAPPKAPNVGGDWWQAVYVGAAAVGIGTLLVISGPRGGSPRGGGGGGYFFEAPKFTIQPAYKPSDVYVPGRDDFP